MQKKLSKKIKRLSCGLERQTRSARANFSAWREHAVLPAHEGLRRRLSWYDRWHQHPHYKKAHWGILGVYLVAIVALFSIVKVAFAADFSDAWDFSSPGDYSLTDSSLIEIVNGHARLKALNYSSDAQTAALYHFDEGTGTTAGDSSPGANTASMIGNPTWAVGNLVNALTFNGSTQSLSVPDSASISMTGSQTVEAWIKPAVNFNNSATRSQVLVDKGSYRLGLDRTSGKAFYEVERNSMQSWTKRLGGGQAGSWSFNHTGLWSMAATGSDVYVGTAGAAGDAEVWKWDNSTWTMIGGDGIRNSWADQTYESVRSLAVNGNTLFAGIGDTSGDGEIWSCSLSSGCSSWVKIGGDAVGTGGPAAFTYTLAGSMVVHGGSLYVGMSGGAGAGDLFRYNGGTSWTQVAGDGLNGSWAASTFTEVSALYSDGSNLYAGLAGSAAGTGDLWKFNGTTWSQIGGDGVNLGGGASWNTNYERVATITGIGGVLYVGLGDSAQDAEVWRLSGTTWSQIGGDGIGGTWNSSVFTRVYSLVNDGTNVYAGLGGGSAAAEVWKYDGVAWTRIGGGATNSTTGWATSLVGAMLWANNQLYAGPSSTTNYGSAMFTWNGSAWTMIGGHYVNNSWGTYNIARVTSSATFNGKLYYGLGSSVNNAQVFEYDGTTARRVGGSSLDGSWPPWSYEAVTSMVAYKGQLYVGLGSDGGDAEVWRWNGSSWSKLAGDGVNSTWNGESSVSSMAVFNDKLYIGLGTTSYMADVWQYDGTSWTQVAGEVGSGNTAINGSWRLNPRAVDTMAVYNGQLCVGLGGSGGYGEVWCWTGSGNWTRISGGNNASLNGSWSSAAEILSLTTYNGKMYASVMPTGHAASIWSWDGSSWIQVAGAGLNSGWVDSSYTWIKSMTVYNGYLYVGTGFSGSSNPTGDVWRYDGTNWTQVGGDSINNSWSVSDNREEVTSLTVFKGKLYAGTGFSPNGDALVYSFGDNAYVESSTSSFSAGAWQHLAGTYDGTNIKIFVNGSLEASSAASGGGVDNDQKLLLGTGYGAWGDGGGESFFGGSLDEVRISNVARSSFTTKPYTTNSQVVGIGTAARTGGVLQWLGFDASESANGGTITYRFSDDNGASWKFWNGTTWATSTSLTQANSKADANTRMPFFPVTFAGMKWQAILTGNGTQQVTLNNVQITSNADGDAPQTNASALTAKKSSGGAVLAQNAWTKDADPYFSWAAGADSGSGIKGYCLYLGTDSTANPVTTKGILGASPVDTGGHCQFLVTATNIDLHTTGYIASPLVTSNSPYYLSVRAIDNAGNVVGSNAQFYFRFDNTPPTNPGYVTAPSNFINTKTATFTWPTSGGSAPADANSGLAGLQYRINNGTWYGDSHTGTQDITDLLVNDGTYSTVDPPDFGHIVEGINTLNFRTYDQAGNYTTSYVNAELKVNTSGAPTSPQNVSVTPTSNSQNDFAFSWEAPATFIGSSSGLSYCYTVNTAPTSNNCTFTSGTSLPAGAYATQPGANTFYVVAKDESGNINYATHATTTFQANTVAPGISTSIDIVDVSIKATSNWRLALTWDPPSAVGSGVSSYKIFRYLNNTTFTQVGSSASTTYIDAGLAQQTYYYRIQACDSTNNCGANSAVVSKQPTGKFTEPATLVTEPTVSNISTRKATISWVTNRESDSRVAIGTKPGEYASSEIANSLQSSSHQLDLANLQAGTTYYYVTKWTDVDGNIGTSSEYVFTTSPAPSVKEASATQVSLSGASIQFTSKAAAQVKIYYGPSEGFGGVKLINTALTESGYTVPLTGLTDGTKYFFKVNTLDSEGNEYESNTYSFTTPARPKISDLALQPVDGEPTSTQKITWKTNVPATSQITYGKVGGDTQEVILSDLIIDHEMIIRGLEDSSQYSLVADSRDGAGNLATSDTQVFKTDLDTRPPKITDIVVESTIRGTGSEARGQIVVSWKTDEPSTSQVAFGEGSEATNIRSQSSEDAALTTEHLVVISDLSTATPYVVQAQSKDRAGNQAKSETQTALIGRASDSILSIIFNTLQRMFGFVVEN